MQYLKSTLLILSVISNVRFFTRSSYLYKWGPGPLLFGVVVSIIIFLILILNSHSFFLWHHQIYHHQGNWNMERKNTMDGFRSGIWRGGQERRMRYVHGIRWYDENWFRNPIKSEASGIGCNIIFIIIINNIIIIGSSSSQKQLHKNNSNPAEFIVIIGSSSNSRRRVDKPCLTW